MSFVLWKRRGAGHRLDGDAACHAVGAARSGTPMRLSRLLRHRLFYQRQAERAGDLDSSAVAAGAEIRDLAMAGRIEVNDTGRVTGVHYHREGIRHYQRARNVVVAGLPIQTPRLLLNSATDRYPDGLANSSGLVGRYFTVQANQAVWGISAKEIRSYKGPPSLALTEHWNYHDAKDFFGGYCYMSQGPLPQLWANTLSGSRGLWGERLMAAMADYNHQVGLRSSAK